MIYSVSSHWKLPPSRILPVSSSPLLLSSTHVLVVSLLRMTHTRMTTTTTSISFPMLVCMAPLTTPEEAKTFLATMREAQQKRERLHRPPSNLNADGMDAWFLRQRKEEQQMRNRRREAETIWRNYRGAYNNGAAGSGGVGRSSLDSQKSGGSTTAAVTTTTPRHSSAGSEHGTDMPSDPNDT